MAFTSSSYNILLSNDGSGNFTPTVIRNATTPASGGTSVSIANVQDTSVGSTTKLPGVANIAALRAVLDDIASGN